MVAVAGGLFAQRALLLVRLVRMAQPSDRSGEVPARLRNEAVIAFGQRKLLQRLVPGLMHAFIFWGFLVLFPTILMALIAVVDRGQTIPWLGHQGWFALLVDVFCVLVLAGVVTAVVIRKVQRPGPVSGQPHGRGRPDPGPDRGHRHHAAPVARLADRAAPERVAGPLVAGVAGTVAPVRRRAGGRTTPSACSCGRTS